jgi:2-polyprenyl-6-hydroxyphenyl methylase/3-demethylubiquinone-9 3-methyltransferase
VSESIAREPSTGGTFMMAELRPIAATSAPCKCCGTDAPCCGLTDFGKHCRIRETKRIDYTGIPIYYYRCPACQFIFTTAFDGFSRDDFLRHIYNDDYLRVDPDYQTERPKAAFAILERLFTHGRPERILDYGGGEGRLAELLRAAGYPHVDTYDPFVPRHATRPQGDYDCVFCIEVVEHSTDPKGTFEDMSRFLGEDSLILFSTLLQPENIDALGLNWWYAGPRNGHVSLYSKASLVRLLRSLGFLFASFNDNIHLAFRTIPPFARHFIKGA